MKSAKGKNPKKILSKKKPEKRLLLPLKKTGGRARSGRITVRRRGGGAKRRYRIIDWAQSKTGQKAKVLALEYDPNRTAFLMLLQYPDNDKRYRLAPDNIKPGDYVIIQEKAELKIGNRMKLKNMPVGALVYNVELDPGRGGKMVRGAGTSAKILAIEAGFVNLEMPSSEIRKIKQDCFASYGQVSFPEHRFIKLEKAGNTRLRGRRPKVRGTAMNPPDHPHGGGRGKSPIGLKHPKTPWGKPALGVKTRRKKKSDKYIISRRRKKKRK